MAYNFKHSPAPWVYYGGDNSSVEIDIKGAVVSVDRFDRMTEEECYSREEMEANGALMGKAPDILSQLVQAKRLLGRLAGAISRGEAGEAHIAEADALADAIDALCRKIEGGQND